MAPRELNFITGNRNKVLETQAILGDTLVVLKTQPLELLEIQGTIEAVVTDKCRRAAEIIKGPVLVEDTSLCFTALKGLPGPYIKWFLDALGPAGLHDLLAAHAEKSAQAVCTFAFSGGPGQAPLLFQGRTGGRIVAPRGETDFGFDPIFEYEGRTFAEMERAEKNQVSHRFKALEKLKAWLLEEK